MADDSLTLAQYVIRDCKARGLAHYFGIPGSGSPMDLMDAAREEGLEFVIAGHESSAVISAAYYGLFKGTAGLMVGIKGVGLGNAVGGVVNAATERVPVVVVCEARGSKVPLSLPLAQHTGPQAAFFGNMLKHAGVLAAGTVAQAWSAATAAALSHGRPGASFLDLPGDLGRTPVGAAEAAQCANEAAATSAQWLQRAGAAQDACEAAAAVLAQYRRPVVIAGADVIRDGACAELAHVVQNVLGAAVLSCMEARGVYDERDPRWAGVLVSRTSPLVIETRLLAAADCIILIGVDDYMVENPFLKDVPTVLELAADSTFGSLTATRGIISGDTSAAQNAGGVADALRLNGHLGRTLAGLARACEASAAFAQAGEIGAGRGFGADEVAAIRKTVLNDCFQRPETDGLTAHDIIAITRKHLPTDGVLFSETGVFVCMLEHLWPVSRPHTFYGTSGGRSMGLTVPALLGAKLAASDKVMVGIGGDGSLLMRLGELESFGRLAEQLRGTPLVIVNDQALGTMQARQRSRNMAPYSLKFHGVDFAAVATACGMGAVTVTNAAEFEAALVAALDPAAPPTLIDARVDARAYQDSFAKTVGNPK